ncbi:hypothetical protein ACFQZC_30185 [Streptacidiphilus monticola]
MESRGFLFGAAVAVELGVGFVPIRKEHGLFPGPKLTRDASFPDYRGARHRLRIQRRSVTAADHVLLVDDWIETGSQARTVKAMVEACGGSWAGCSVIVDQADALGDDVRQALGVRGIVHASELPPHPN